MNKSSNQKNVETVSDKRKNPFFLPDLLYLRNLKSGQHLVVCNLTNKCFIYHKQTVAVQHALQIGMTQLIIILIIQYKVRQIIRGIGNDITR